MEDLQRSLSNLTILDLKQELKKRGLSLTGSKYVLIERLMENWVDKLLKNASTNTDLEIQKSKTQPQLLRASSDLDLMKFRESLENLRHEC